MLTGEPMPIQKFIVEPGDQLLEGRFAARHQVYAGTNVLQSSGNDDGNALLLCTATGGLTAKGQLVRMVLYPQSVDFKFDAHLRVFYVVFGCMSVLLTAVYLLTTENASWTTTVFAGLSILSESCNPMIPVAIVWAQSVSSHWLLTDIKGLGKSAKIQCLVPARIPIAGKSHVIVFDKTGTITKDGMDFMGVVPVNDCKFENKIDVANDTSWFEKLPVQLQYAVGVCHTVTILGMNGTLVGNHVEVSMVTVSGWKLPAPNASEKIFSPPDDNRNLEAVTVVRELPFDHHRMTSGVVIKLKDGSLRVLLKGSYERIGVLCEKIPSDYVDITSGLASDSFYVLGVASKDLEVGCDYLSLSRDELEAGLDVAGLLMFKNEMKPDSPDAIRELREG